MCDPGLRRRHSSECEEEEEEDRFPEMDSGLSTLRRSHGGYDLEHEAKTQDEEEEEKELRKKVHIHVRDIDESMLEENSDTEVGQKQMKLVDNVAHSAECFFVG